MSEITPEPTPGEATPSGEPTGPGPAPGQEEGTAADFNEIIGEMVRPETPEGYSFGEPDWPTYLPAYSAELEGSFKEIAHKHGLTPEQAQGLRDDYLALNREALLKADDEFWAGVKEAKAVLMQKWGSEFESVLAEARRAQRLLAPEDSPAFAALDRVLGDDPALIEFFYNLSQRFKEDPGKPRVEPGAQADLEAKRRELMAHPAYLDKGHPEHKKIINEVRGIYQQLFPEPKT